MSDKWIQIKATAENKYLDDICTVMSMIDAALMIEDYSDVERDLDGVFGDLIDEELLARDRTQVSVSVYIPEIKNPAESEGFIRERLAALSVPATVGGILSRRHRRYRKTKRILQGSHLCRFRTHRQNPKAHGQSGEFAPAPSAAGGV